MNLHKKYLLNYLSIMFNHYQIDNIEKYLNMQINIIELQTDEFIDKYLIEYASYKFILFRMYSYGKYNYTLSYL